MPWDYSLDKVVLSRTILIIAVLSQKHNILLKNCGFPQMLLRIDQCSSTFTSIYGLIKQPSPKMFFLGVGSNFIKKDPCQDPAKIIPHTCTSCILLSEMQKQLQSEQTFPRTTPDLHLGISFCSVMLTAGHECDTRKRPFMCLRAH